MKSLKNDVKAWLLLCSGLGTILFLMGSTFYIVVSQSLGSVSYTHLKFDNDSYLWQYSDVLFRQEFICKKNQQFV